MSLEPRRGRSNVANALCALAIVTATATAAEVEAERGTGLPDRGEWTFNLDIGVGAFGFDNSLYGNQRPDPSGDLSDDWFESYIKPALAVEFPIKRGALFAKASAVGVRTFSAPPTLVGDDASSFEIEYSYVGWRSGDSLGGTDDLLQSTLGRAPYHLGHGMLIWDGAGDGGSRGGFWSGARQAWESSAVGRLQSGAHALE